MVVVRLGVVEPQIFRAAAKIPFVQYAAPKFGWLLDRESNEATHGKLWGGFNCRPNGKFEKPAQELTDHGVSRSSRFGTAA